MDLSLTDSQEALKRTARDFVRREAPNDVLMALDETESGFDESSWRKAADAGWLGMLVPEQYGGFQGSLLDAGLLFEELGKAPLPGPYFTSGVLGPLVLLECGSEAQRQSLLPELVEGRSILSLALTELDYGWKPESIKMQATRRGNSFVLNGEKYLVPFAASATHFVCAARVEEGVALFLVDRIAPGVSVRTLKGFFARWMNVVRFDAVELPSSAILGAPGNAWQSLDRAIVKALPVLSAYMVGGCQTAFDLSLAYSQTRVQFGQPIGRFQLVQDHIISIVNHLDAARLTTYEALWKLDTGRPARMSVHMAKAVGSDAYYQACMHAHKVHGGLGYGRDYGLTRHTTMSRVLYDYLGNPAHHRAQLAAAILTAERGSGSRES